MTQYVDRLPTWEHTHSPTPLPEREFVTEEDDRAQNGEELACGGDDRTRERPKVTHH